MSNEELIEALDLISRQVSTAIGRLMGRTLEVHHLVLIGANLDELINDIQDADEVGQGGEGE